MGCLQKLCLFLCQILSYIFHKHIIQLFYIYKLYHNVRNEYKLVFYSTLFFQDNEHILISSDANDKVLCPRCGSPVITDAQTCVMCGFAVNRSVTPRQLQKESEKSNNSNNSKHELVVNEDSAGNVTVFRANAHAERELVCKSSGIGVVISKSPFKIGKLLESSDLRIENHAVSRKHAEIVKEGNNYYVIDYYSKNGTYINERRIQSGVKEPLQINDSIRFADSEYLFK